LLIHSIKLSIQSYTLHKSVQDSTAFELIPDLGPYSYSPRSILASIGIRAELADLVSV